MKNLCHLATLLVCLQTVLLKVPALAMKVTQPIKIIAERNNVTLKCVYNITGDGKAQVFRVTVYKSNEEKNSEVCAASFNNSMKPFEKRDVLHCIGQPRRNSISIQFIGMNMSHSDWYFCKVEKMFPLPYTQATGNGTWIFIKPDVEALSVPSEKKRCPQVTEAALIILALASLFLLYSIVVTYLHWVLKNKQEEQNNEYINMEPPKHASGRKRRMQSEHRT
ncbi:T-cell-specific surface glycoprotein CD28-like isoform X4 [Leucoraja erinacea]|uniref:T-cell-specific surface glycoprotein CD28-like isoform X4 n=1 Tax=Leucoraja erinaceus TaxID=7782 RepID=UPI002458B51F|nr:T-cell-specific surface glycoprotein CD28-like isoform X4 [Leucoraja erinacea]